MIPLPPLSEGAKQLARDCVNMILENPNFVWTRSSFVKTVVASAIHVGLPPSVAEDSAYAVGEWLEGEGYLQSVDRTPDGICDCDGCRKGLVVTPAGVAFAAEPPWNSDDDN